MLDSLIMLAVHVASIYDEKNKSKYKDEIIEAYKEIQDEELKENCDDGRISYLRQRIMRISTILRDSTISKNS